MSTWLKIFIAGIILVAISLAIVFVGYCVELPILKILGAGGVAGGLVSSAAGIAIVNDDKEA